MDEQVRQVYERLAPDAEEAMIANLAEAAELERSPLPEPEPSTFRERVVAAQARLFER